MNFIIVSSPSDGQAALHFRYFTLLPFTVNLITLLIAVGGGIAETGNHLLNSLVHIYGHNNGQMWMHSAWQTSNAALPDTNVSLGALRCCFPCHNPRGGRFTGSDSFNHLFFLLSTIKSSSPFLSISAVCNQPLLGVRNVTQTLALSIMSA